MNIITKLSIMMFLQFFIWGAWYTSVSNFMAEQGLTENIYWVFTAGPLAAIIAPFFIGLIANRFFNTEKVLAVLFFLCGISLFLLPNFSESSSAMNACILIHMLLYMPTLALTASLSFTHLKNASKEFPLVRVWGTIGWIIAGVVISTLNADKTSTQFTVAGIAGIILGIFSLSLPKTPAPLKGEPVETRTLFFVDAWALLKEKSFFVFIISSTLICIPLAAYYAYSQLQLAHLGVEDVAATKTLGQGSEIIFMLLMPFFFRKLGIKKIIAIGILAWAARYLLFAFSISPETISLFYIGLLLHGICYDFFFVAGQVYVEQTAPKAIRAQAQSMLVFFTQGVGLYLGAYVAGSLFNSVFPNKENISTWTAFWIPLMLISLVIFVLFIIFFNPKTDKKES